MDIREHVVALNERRMRIHRQMQDHIDDCIRTHPGEPMSVEEREKLDRMNTEIGEIDAEVRSFVAREEREATHGALREAEHQVFGEERVARKEQSEAEQFRAWARGETRGNTTAESGNTTAFAVRAADIDLARQERDLIRKGATAEEVRTLLWDTGSLASAVPTSMARTLYEVLQEEISLFRAPTTRFTTASGENMDFPYTTTHGIATQVIAQGTAIGGTDPVLAKMTLGSYKYGQLVQVASEVVADAVFPVVPWVTAQVGRAVGRVIDADLVVGTGTGEPLGIMAAVTGSGTIATGGSLIDPTYEKLIDLQYSIKDAYRNGGRAGWLMRDSTAGTIRKLRSGNGGTEGSPLWQPVITNGLSGYGAQDQLLGFPVFTDANVAALASNAKIVGFGDFGVYYVRQVGDFVFERSDDYAFNTDLVSFRGKWRVDGDMIDTSGWNILKRSV